MKVKFLGTPDFVKPVQEVIGKNFDLVGEKADIIVVASYGKILTLDELNAPKYGAINIHPSRLPEYRGPSPIQTQILEGVRESAITFIKMDELVDHGPILKSVMFEFLDDDTFESAAKRAFETAADTLPEVIKQYTSGKIKPVQQDHSKASYTKTLARQDGYIDLDSLEIGNWKLEIERMIRAYYPWPGVWTKFNGKIVKLLPDKKIQVEGKKPMSYKDFINGYKEGEEFLKKLNLH